MPCRRKTTHSFRRPSFRSLVVVVIDIYFSPSKARAHPGGVAVLQAFSAEKNDATKAFYAAHHSPAAIAMLQTFAMVKQQPQQQQQLNDVPHATRLPDNGHGHGIQTVAIESSSLRKNKVPRWRDKLFTEEDPTGVHKGLGIFVLLHFAFRYYQMLWADPSAGLGSRRGRGPSWIPLACLLPHGLLSLSSLIFPHVPKDRVVGKPMIWQEYRVHNIGFGLRSVCAAALCSVSIHRGHTPAVRRVAVWGTAASCLAAIVAADVGTKYLRSNEYESTTATMPYWDGCRAVTQQRFKTFYAYSQFMATLGCLAVTNPAYPFAILLAIQMASLLMTLVRKGLLTVRGYHLGYTATLIAPYIVGLRSVVYMKSPDVIVLFALGGFLFQLRRRGVGKYAIWLPVIAARISVGDKYLSYGIW